MRIPTLVHGALDFATAAAVMVLPRRLGASPALTMVLTAKALGVLGYSLCTRYELGLVKVLPMRTHLLLDGVTAAGMCALPIVFSNEPAAMRGAMLGMGLFELATTLSTEPEPADPDLLPDASGAVVDRLERLSHDAERRFAGVSPV
jgi:hypothetical protein